MRRALFSSIRCLPALLVALAVLAPGAQRAEAAEAGVVPDITWGVSRSEVDRTVADMREAGVAWIRANVSWKSLEPNAKGEFSDGYLREIDYAIDQAQAAGIKVIMPLSDSVPYWASADPDKRLTSQGPVWNPRYRPTSMADYADALSYLVSHFAPRGVHVYEVWNEPNHPYFWPSGPNAAEYVSMLRPAYQAATAADPSSTVLLGGLERNDKAFLQKVYDAGGGPYFDAVADHLYPDAGPRDCWNGSDGEPSRDALCGIEGIRRVMVANGDAEKDVWVTEFGWSTCQNADPDCWGKGVSEARQAEYLKGGFNELDSYPWVKAALWYDMRNTYFRNEDPGDWNGNLGLLRIDHTRKPAFWAFRAWATTVPTRTSITKVRRHSRKGGRALSARVRGTVRSPSGGAVKLRVQRRRAGRWSVVDSKRLPVVNGSFAARLRLGRGAGRRRVRAQYTGNPRFRPSDSGYVRVR